MPCEPQFTVTLTARNQPVAVWRRLWDLERHTRFIPFTRVRTVDGPLRLGVRFVGVTTLGPFRLEDRMVVEEWEPPRRAVIRKVGPLLRGRIVVTLLPRGDGTRLVWRQTFGARGVPDALARVAAPVVRLGYLGALRRIIGRD